MPAKEGNERGSQAGESAMGANCGPGVDSMAPLYPTTAITTPPSTHSMPLKRKENVQRSLLSAASWWGGRAGCDTTAAMEGSKR